MKETISVALFRYVAPEAEARRRAKNLYLLWTDRLAILFS